MRYVMLFFCASMLSVAWGQSGNDENLPVAFPGAEGFGKYASGGRGGKVYVVTNLNDSGPGSLRDGIKLTGPRIITFAVSGTIALESILNIRNGDLTIAGQTAPGDGICLKNYPTKVYTENVVIRYLRFRLGDARKIEDDAISGIKGKNIIIDHCSMSWSVDECASFYNNDNFTLQWCIISESLNASVHSKGEHGYGGIWGGRKASFHHNLLASHTSRLPRFSGSSTTPNTPDELVDFRNNVIYNWGNNNTYGGERGQYNVVNNFYKAGPATGKTKTWILNPTSPVGKFYLDGNMLYRNMSVSKDNWSAGGVKVNDADSARATAPFLCEPILAQTAEAAYMAVLKNAGASFSRDVVDARIVSEVQSGLSTMGKKKNGIIDSQTQVGGWPELKSLDAPPDADHDGIPDEWENKNKLNPGDPKDAVLFTLSKIYTNVEVYINSLTHP